MYLCKNSKIQLNIANLNFYIFWTILLLGKGMGYVSGNWQFRAMTWMAIVFISIKLCLTDWKYKELLFCFFLNLIGIGVFYCSKDASILLTILTITGLKNINLINLFKLSFWIKGMLYISRTSLAILGIIDPQKMVRSDLGDIHTVRYGLGYGQPNSTHYILFSIVVLCVLAYGKKLKVHHYFLLEIYNVFIYHYTNSRTGLLMTTALIFGSVIVLKGNHKFLKLVTKFISDKIYIFCSLVSFLIIFLFSTQTWLLSLQTLSGRFITGYMVLTQNKISLLGSPDIVTDFGYINILYADGLIVFCLFLIAYTKITYFLQKKSIFPPLLVMICYAIYTLSEAYTTSILMNMSIIYLAIILYPDDLIYEEENYVATSQDCTKKWKFKI